MTATMPTDFWIEGVRLLPSGCWSHTNRTHSTGYHRTTIDGRLIKAHRVAYEWLVGPIPEGLFIDHLCRNRYCLNPEHMEPVTLAENILRGVSPPAINAAKTHCVNGHEFTPENTRINKHGRRCRTCHRERQARYNQREFVL